MKRFWPLRALRREKRSDRKPDLSVVVVVYNIPREIPRTLFSLSASYQRHIHPDEYEVILVDNGSNPPLDHRLLEGLSGNFRIIRIDPAAPSPAHAVNVGIAAARADIIGVMIDGARIASPGIFHFARYGARLYDKAIVAALGWYLGYDHQRWSMIAGYDHAREDALLASIEWQQDGYRLFEISTMDESSTGGWLAPINESNAIFMSREVWGLLGGMDERFKSPGGGLVNLDTYGRAIELPDAELVILLGEGTFHQLHGGVATNLPVASFDDHWQRWSAEYEVIRQTPFVFKKPKSAPTYLGSLPRPVLARFTHAALAPTGGYDGPPLGDEFDRQVWSLKAPARPADPVIAALVELAQAEFRAGRYAATAAVARLIRSRAPEEPEPQRLLSLVSPWLQIGPPQEVQTSDYYVALAEAYRHLGENEMATANYRTALNLDRNLVQAHIGLATLRMPGELYYSWLERLYSSCRPKSVLEVGVADGASLALVSPPTVAIGVDPNPTVIRPLKAETHIFPETSDEFFSRRRLDSLLAGRPLGIGFIDGLHLYEQSLRDFINLESYCGTRSMILLHDTFPLDEATQSRARDTDFHTGDVWKTVLCLKHYRPNLDIFTIATPWTGLTVVTGLDPTSGVLSTGYDEAVARFIDLPFSEIENQMDGALNIVPNDWNIVEERLKTRQIL